MIASSHGEYIAFLEGDDYWTASDKRQLQAAFFAERSDCALCHHRVSYLDDLTRQIVGGFSAPGI